MNSNNTPDPLLQQVPLIRNPAFQPPRPITLNADYGKLLAALPGSIIPPKPSVNPEELKGWVDELRTLEEEKLNPETRDREIAVYENWLKASQLKVAPGFSFDVMTPTAKDESA